jgi:A/G-specific adenine glycosylase
MRVDTTTTAARWLQDPDEVARFRAALAAFFAHERRDLPWRETTDPYAILVSEIMLQQTRVETVLPYYRSWMNRFPDLATLASASDEEVLRAWQGLGYYRRARNLHRLALQLTTENRPLPSKAAELLSLPGIGAYTAGAVASIAFGEAVPAVDGNVRRVLARLLDDPSPSVAGLVRIVALLVDPKAPGDFNQALMELGAVVCQPRSPRCGACPVAFACASRKAGTQAERPAPPRRREIPHMHEAALILMRPGRNPDATTVLLVRRPDDGLLAGMWSLPTLEFDPTKFDPGSAHAGLEPARHLAARLVAGPVPRGRPLRCHTHVFTHRKVTYHPVQFLLPAGTNPSDPTSLRSDPCSSLSICPAAAPQVARWVDRTGLDTLPIPRAQQHLLGGADWSGVQPEAAIL